MSSLMYLRLGQSLEAIAGKYDLPLAAVYAATAYYYDHQAEIDQNIAADQAFAEAFNNPSTALPLAELTRSAIHLLCQEIGAVNTARFLNQSTLGYGDYTEDREQLFGALTVEDIVAEIKRKRSGA